MSTASSPAVSPPAPAGSAVPAPALAAPRYVSLDEFRGFIVAAMFAVNCSLFPTLEAFEHESRHARFADMIMPGFLFAAGFSLRLTAVRRYPQIGFPKMAWSYVRRSALLILIVLCLGNFDGPTSWERMNELPSRHADASPEVRSRQRGQRERRAQAEQQPSESAERTEPSNWPPKHFLTHYWYWFLNIFHQKTCEVLGIIAISQLFVLPVILLRPSLRIVAFFAYGLVHVLITYWFNWDFMHGSPNAIDALLRFKPHSTWDGGFFGNLTWGAMMIAGSLSYDVMASPIRPLQKFGRLLGWGVALMVLGYAVSIPRQLYVTQPEGDAPEFAQSLRERPVFPPLTRASQMSFKDWLPPVPVIQHEVPSTAENYWMMSKRYTTLPFVLFSSGFSMALLSLWVLLTDVIGITIGFFRTYGSNALLAYVIHEPIHNATMQMYVADGPAWYQHASSWVFFYVVLYLLLHALEKRKIYVRL